MAERPLLTLAAWRWWLGFFAVVVFALYMTARAYVEGLPEVFKTVKHFDKVGHFGTAGMLAFFLDGALGRRSLPVFGLAIPLAAIGVLVPSGIEEFVQRYAEYRSSTFGDFAADVIGVAILIPISRWIAK